jgi:DNA-binding Lrp family transcriptional regulator
MDDLIPLLRQNARAPIEDLAKELNVEEADVAQRISRLERDGVILGYQAIIDPQKIETNTVTAIIEVKITPERDGGFDRLASRIAKFAEVQSCYLMSGGYDLMVVVEGDTLKEVALFISEKLSTITGVISTATHFRLKAYKENGVELHREERPERLAVAP